MKKHYLYDYQITDSRLIKTLTTSKYFNIAKTREDLYGNLHIHYEFKGYHQPLLCYISNNFCRVNSPYNYSGSYNYNGEDIITLHSTYGRFQTYKKFFIFGVPFMVNSTLEDEEIILAAETDIEFIKSLIKAL